MTTRIFLSSVLLLTSVGCSSFANPEPKAVVSEIDQWGCTPPSPSVFTQAGLDIKLAQSTFGKIVTGDLSITTDPKVTSLATAAQRDAELRSYLRCLAINRDGLSPERALHLEEMTAFLSLAPTAEQFLEWRRDNPSPQSSASGGPVPTTGTVGLGGETFLRVPIAATASKEVTLTLSNVSPGNRATKGSDLDRFRIFDQAGVEVTHGAESRIEPGHSSTVRVSAVAGSTYYAHVAARVQNGAAHVAQYQLMWK